MTHFQERRDDSVRGPDALDAHARSDERGVETGFIWQGQYKQPLIERGGNRYA